MRLRVLLGVLVSAATAVLPARAFVRFDFDQRYFVQPGYIVKDHSLIQADDGTFHLFYIKADESVPESQRAKALGHATSTDLRHWTFHPDVIPVVPGTWEEAFVWAPHVIRVGNAWLMFYTGVNLNYAQAIGVAGSADLYTWIKSDLNPVYTPSTTWAAWDPNAWSNCRDPFVFEDNGTYYLLTTASTLDSKGAISLASSTNLITWTDLGPLLVHPGSKAWHVFESTNMIQKDGVYHLFLTEQNSPGASWMSAPTLFGPWDYFSMQPFDPGHATEIFQIQGKWTLSRHTTFTFQGGARYVIKFDDLNWNTAGKPLVAYTNPLEGWTIWSGDAFYLQPTFWDNSLERGSDPSGFGGNSWIGTYELFTGPLQVGFPGLTAGEEPQGSIRTAPFTLTGNRLAFRIGGGRDLDHLHVALYTADDSQKRLWATGEDSDTMTEVIWDVGLWTGSSVFLEIADLSSASWGHINVDEIHEYYEAPTDVEVAPDAQLALHQNTPNPFNPSTRIAVDLPVEGRAKLDVFDVRGRRVQSLLDTRLPAGRHTVIWLGTSEDGTRVASGVYYYRLQFEDRAPIVRSMLLLK